MRMNRAAIKGNAKLAMREARPSPMLVALVYYVVAGVLQLLSARLLYGGMLTQIFSARSLDEFASRYQYYVTQAYTPGVTAWLLNIAISIIVTVLAVGFTIYALEVSRRRPAGFGQLLDGFGIFFKVLWLYIVMGVFVWLWSLLLIVPGIVASFRYRQAVYLLVDHPDWSVLECIRESKAMMRGRKGELFVLDLSFIGWSFLCAIPFVSIWVYPYMEVTYANYYGALLQAPSIGSGGYGGQTYDGGPNYGGQPYDGGPNYGDRPYDGGPHDGDGPSVDNRQPPSGGPPYGGPSRDDAPREDRKPPWEL